MEKKHEFIVTFIEGTHGFLVESCYDEKKPLVRCKDCKHWFRDEACHVCALTGDLRKADWFCADAEKKEDDSTGRVYGGFIEINDSMKLEEI